MGGYLQGALRKELRSTPFVERLKTVSLNFTSTWNNLLKHWISAEFFLMEGYVQGALRKELHIAPFVERFNTATLGRSC